ncbi:replication protein [Leuconostoc falkenbergense]|uniref:replication protein n=1 Tax=Leuconostoc falkenbergense TaxID=2766470 RepID=UPI0024AD9E27|nr:replication protein [Leuconostoc falkenbergense]MDI6667059.1 replication protein [Leuconostoc falkenbergense]
MPVTDLSNTIIPVVFDKYVLNTILKTNRFIKSGIIVPDQTLGDQLMQPGDEITIPFLNDLSGDPQAWTDTEDIDVANLTTGSQRAIKFRQAKAFGSTEISRMVSGAPIAETIATRFANYWNNVDQTILNSTLKGVFLNDKVANTKLFDQTVVSPSTPTFGAKGFLAAIGLLGDLQDQTFTKIAVNSATYSQMKYEGMISTIQPQGSVTPINYYNNMEVIVDDDIPLETGGIATAYIYGSGAVSYSTVLHSTEVVHEPLKQGGRDSVVNKRVSATHVNGTTLAKSFNPAGQTTIKDELAKGTTWDIADGVDPRNIRVVAYKSKLDDDFVPAAFKGTPSQG